MAATETQLDLDLRLVPGRTARHQFHRQIARLERELAEAVAKLDVAHRPSRATSASTAAPRLLTSGELEATRDALVARISEAHDLRARQSADRAEAEALLKRMTEDPAEFRWTTVTTKDLGVDGCKSWQSVPVLGPVGMLGNWWRVRMSSGCP
ncbi:MAG TPA: hypothetical protein VM093_07840 [Aeromicrobium sp.]|nr:hypothetical protein [Aeromicrobium sp.]